MVNSLVTKTLKMLADLNNLSKRIWKCYQISNNLLSMFVKEIILVLLILLIIFRSDKLSNVGIIEEACLIMRILIFLIDSRIIKIELWVNVKMKLWKSLLNVNLTNWLLDLWRRSAGLWMEWRMLFLNNRLIFEVKEGVTIAWLIHRGFTWLDSRFINRNGLRDWRIAKARHWNQNLII